MIDNNSYYIYARFSNEPITVGYSLTVLTLRNVTKRYKTFFIIVLSLMLS